MLAIMANINLRNKNIQICIFFDAGKGSKLYIFIAKMKIWLLKPQLVNDGTSKFTKSKLLEAADEYGLTPYLAKLPAISDGGLISVADKQKDLTNDIEMKIKIRCGGHTVNRITENVFIYGLQNIDKKLGSSNFEGYLKFLL